MPLVNDLKVDDLINTRRYLELFEVSKRNDDDVDSVRSEDSTPNSDDEAFINDRNLPDLVEDSDDDDDEEDILWMGAELERRLLNNADVDRVVLVSLVRSKA